MIKWLDMRGDMRYSQNICRAAAMAGLLTLAWGCRPGPSADIPPTWVWDQDQKVIVPLGGSRHAWNGWVIDGNDFAATETASRMILWSRTGRKAKLHITYSLNGRPVGLIVNKRRALSLDPARSLKSAEFEIVLNRGRNFLEFDKRDQDALRISRVTIDRADEPLGSQLLAGESVTIFLNPGQGRIEWRGSGRLTVEKRESGDGLLTAEIAEYKTGFLSRTIACKIAMTTSGVLTITADSGHFDVSRFSYVENPKPQAAEAQPKIQGRPPIFILLADACQAEHLGIYGYPRRTAPHIEEFAREAVLFENAYANASFTRSSVRSLLTGMYPEKSGIDNLTRVAESRLPIMPEFLKVKGYRTSIFTSAVTISPTFGFTKGIDDYFQYLDVLEKTRERKIDLDRFGRWLKTPGPLFSYIHFIEPHLPIVAPPPFLDMFAGPSSPKGVPREKRLISLLQYAAGKKRAYTTAEIQSIRDDYDSTIAYVDSEIGRALEQVRKAGLFDDSLIIIMADHGEAMSEHGAWGHANNVFEETTHIPLLVKFPASMGLKGRVRRLVQVTDIYPTLLDLFGQDIALPGKSLLEAVRNPNIDDAMAVSQSISEIAQFGMRWRGWYFITGLRFNQSRLYNLEVDPLKDAGPGAEPVRRYFEARFLSWLKSSGDGTDAATSIDLKKMSPTEIENLKSLGYLKSP
jgi:arylsulfatase A-like enzyme